MGDLANRLGEIYFRVAVACRGAVCEFYWAIYGPCQTTPHTKLKMIIAIIIAIANQLTI